MYTFADLWRHVKPLHKPGQDTTQASEEMLARIIAKHNEPHRHHHGVPHLDDLARKLWPLIKNAARENQVFIVLMIGWHDFIYSTKMDEYSYNEGNSAVEAAQAVHAADIDTGVSFVVQRLRMGIEATKEHATDGQDFFLQLFLDADMSILGAKPETYRWYRANVMAEFLAGGTTREEYLGGRAAFLQDLQRRMAKGGNPIFKTEAFKHLERPALENVKAELHWIDLGAPSEAVPVREGS